MFDFSSFVNVCANDWIAEIVDELLMMKSSYCVGFDTTVGRIWFNCFVISSYSFTVN